MKKLLLTLASFALVLSVSLPALASIDGDQVTSAEKMVQLDMAVIPAQPSANQAIFAAHDGAALEARPENVFVVAMAGADAVCMSCNGKAEPLWHTRMNL